ncbi:MAG: IS3 family transposase [Methylophagaceae bacterium]
MKYAFIKYQRRWHALTRLCSVLDVSTSGYYDWLDRPLSATERSKQGLLTKIHCFHQASRRTYGSPRIHQDLIASGEKISINRVAKLMKTAGIQSKMAKRFIITTNSKESKNQWGQTLTPLICNWSSNQHHKFGHLMLQTKAFFTYHGQQLILN